MKQPGAVVRFDKFPVAVADSDIRTVTPEEGVVW